jgi:hypothetical protein
MTRLMSVAASPINAPHCCIRPSASTTSSTIGSASSNKEHTRDHVCLPLSSSRRDDGYGPGLPSRREARRAEGTGRRPTAPANRQRTPPVAVAAKVDPAEVRVPKSPAPPPNSLEISKVPAPRADDADQEADVTDARRDERLLRRLRRRPLLPPETDEEDEQKPPPQPAYISRRLSARTSAASRREHDIAVSTSTGVAAHVADGVDLHEQRHNDTTDTITIEIWSAWKEAYSALEVDPVPACRHRTRRLQPRRTSSTSASTNRTPRMGEDRRSR